jgi:magnesium-transporting ATPase (P-type)
MAKLNYVDQRQYHAMEPADVLDALGGGAGGLSQEEAARRLTEHGPNKLRPPRRKSAVVRFLAQFHDVLIYVLLAAAVVTAALEHWIDTAVIAAVVVVNAIIGFIQEGKAERALEAIRGMLTTRAEVIRGGERHTIPAADLVPGDLVVLSSGDKVPADLRVLHARELRIDEALLTGESKPVAKAEERVTEDAQLADRRSMAWSGTLVTTGAGRGIVTATAEQTEIGRISELVGETAPLATPLVRKVTTFGRQLSLAILVLAASPRPAGRRDVPGGGRARRGGDPGGPAGHHDHRARHRGAADGAPKGHHPQARGRRHARRRHRHLLGQDGDADAQRDDGHDRRAAP